MVLAQGQIVNGIIFIWTGTCRVIHSTKPCQPRSREKRTASFVGHENSDNPLLFLEQNKIMSDYGSSRSQHSVWDAHYRNRNIRNATKNPVAVSNSYKVRSRHYIGAESALGLHAGAPNAPGGRAANVGTIITEMPTEIIFLKKVCFASQSGKF